MEAVGEIHVRTTLLWHSLGWRQGDPTHKCCGKKLSSWTSQVSCLPVPRSVRSLTGASSWERCGRARSWGRPQTQTPRQRCRGMRRSRAPRHLGAPFVSTKRHVARVKTRGSPHPLGWGPTLDTNPTKKQEHARTPQKNKRKLCFSLCCLSFSLCWSPFWSSLPVGCCWFWLFYLQFRGTRQKLQGGFLDPFNLSFGKFSVNFRDEFSRKNH